ncbi:DUF1801 domain-containing protein [Roseivirga sp.]|uniref:DUF1801 domain-containing protein n=1 Tax=Roseivirga sp. TaxID=1964215 RepID=UPI003B8B0BE9
MLRDLDNWYLNKSEPNKSCLQALRIWIQNSDEQITEAWKYRMPFFCFKGKMFCYLWVDKKSHQPYIGIVKGNQIKHKALLQEKRAKMKILPINPNKDLPIGLIGALLEKAKTFY